METHKSSQFGSSRGSERLSKRINRSVSPAKSGSSLRSAKSPKRASRSPTKGSQEDRPTYIMELPAVDFKYKCPECSHDTYKRAQFIYHAKTVHSRDYEIFYQCIGCRKRFEQMRDCNSHCQACNRVQKAADVQADKDKRKARQLRSDASPFTFKPLSAAKEAPKPSAVVEPKRALNENQTEELKGAQNKEAELFNLDPKRTSQEKELIVEPYSVHVKVPLHDGRFYCPECNKDFIRKDRTISHCRSEHGRSILFTFECLYCDKLFEEMRNASTHVKFCPKFRSSKAEKQPVVSSKSQANHRQARRPSPYALQTSNKSRDASQRPSSSTDEPTTWEMLFFTELGRSLVQNPQSAEALVKVVPIMRNITREVVTKLGYTASK